MPVARQCCKLWLEFAGGRGGVKNLAETEVVNKLSVLY